MAVILSRPQCVNHWSAAWFQKILPDILNLYFPQLQDTLKLAWGVLQQYYGKSDVKHWNIHDRLDQYACRRLRL